MYKNATKCNETVGKWCKNKHGASKIIDTFETYQTPSGRCDEHSSKFFPQLETKVYQSGEEKANTTKGDACKLRDSSGQFIWCLIQALPCEQQCGTYTQPNRVLCSQLTMRLSISPVCLKQRV
jgi:hypothetical protein